MCVIIGEIFFLRFRVSRHFSSSQYVSIYTAVNIITFAYGNVIGWLSSALGSLQSETAPSADVEGTGMLITFAAIGSLLSLMFCEPMTRIFGTRVTLACMALPQLVRTWLIHGWGCTLYFLAFLVAGSFRRSVLVPAAGGRDVWSKSV